MKSSSQGLERFFTSRVGSSGSVCCSGAGAVRGGFGEEKLESLLDVNRVDVDERAVDDMTVDERAVDELAVDERAVDDMAVDERAVEEAAVEGAGFEPVIMKSSFEEGVFMDMPWRMARRRRS